MRDPGDVDHVIAAIDGALEDWSVSGDAMRWTPEPKETEPVRGTGLYFAPLGTPPPLQVEFEEPADLRPYMDAIRQECHRMAMAYGVSHVIIDEAHEPIAFRRYRLDTWTDDGTA